ncbi:hypothetical protein J6590_083514 [Homalodisca vitripennis]|nr:hypothetical protein J6590_083514 [Homalodisca vitripennis]
MKPSCTTRVELQQTAPTDSRVAQSPADGESIPQRVAVLTRTAVFLVGRGETPSSKNTAS